MTGETQDSVEEFLEQECSLDESYLYYIKQWGYIRAYMDNDEEDTVNVLKQLIKSKKHDVRDIAVNTSKLSSYFIEDLEREEAFYLPDCEEDIKNLPTKSIIIGGGKDECLAEMEIIFEAYNKKTKRFNKFIF